MMWAPFPALYRRLRQSGFSDTQINEPLVRMAEDGIIKDAQRQSLIDGENSIVEFMARLQHYGGATRFLDVTTDPLVALYFASGGDPRNTGIVYRYRINPERVYRLEKQTVEWNTLINLAKDGRPLHVIPRAYDRRIKVQSGSFLMTSLPDSLAVPNMFTNQTYDAEVHHIWISPQLKSPLRRHLAEKGINKSKLFPSIENFAKAHSTNNLIERLL